MVLRIGKGGGEGEGRVEFLTCSLCEHDDSSMRGGEMADSICSLVSGARRRFEEKSCWFLPVFFFFFFVISVLYPFLWLQG